LEDIALRAVVDTGHNPSPIRLIQQRAAAVPGLDVDRLPKRWQKIGRVLVLRPLGDLAPMWDAIAPIYADVLGAETVVEDRGRIHGPWRVPDVLRTWGGGTGTEHLEDGVRFKLDVARVMFSPGNLGERMRIARIGRPGETVVDLFAGIGYFSLPIAVHGSPSRVVACEVNPIAHHYLLENIRLNRAGTVEARLGDCRAVAPEGVADRVILGHFEAVKYLDVAFESSRGSATLHVHGLSRLGGRRPEEDADRGIPPPEIRARLHEAAVRHGYRVLDARTRFAKWYGPHRAHVVVDASVVRE
jgi:tRNA wybutosine-synthesizing protein 2